MLARTGQGRTDTRPCCMSFGHRPSRYRDCTRPPQGTVPRVGRFRPRTGRSTCQVQRGLQDHPIPAHRRWSRWLRRLEPRQGTNRHWSHRQPHVSNRSGNRPTDPSHRHRRQTVQTAQAEGSLRRRVCGTSNVPFADRTLVSCARRVRVSAHRGHPFRAIMIAASADG